MTAPAPSPTATRTRPARYDGAETRRHLIDAALAVFARVGFEGASMRAIAAAAGIEQGHLTYYFPSKMALWQRVIEACAQEPERRLRERLPASADLSAPDAARAVLPHFLQAFAENPGLTRLMLQELSVSSDRSTWLEERFARPVWALLHPLFLRLQAAGCLGGSTPEIAYFSMIGAALITFGNARLVQQFTCHDPLAPAWVDQAIAHMLAPVLAPAARCRGNDHADRRGAF